MPQSESVITLTPAETPVVPATSRQERSADATVLSGSFIMLVAMMLVNIFNFAYNMVMARMLGPGAFGNINAAVIMIAEKAADLVAGHAAPTAIRAATVETGIEA